MHKRPDLCNRRKPHSPLVHLAVLQFVRLLRPRLVLWSHPLIHRRPWSRPLVISCVPLISSVEAAACHLTHHCFQSHIVFMVLVFSYHHWQTVYILSVPLTPARHSPSPHFCVHPPLLSLAQRAFLQLYRSSSTTPMKDLRALLSTNQVVIHAAKIRGLIKPCLYWLAAHCV